MLVLAVVYSAPALAETTTQATLTGTQSDLKLNSQVTINKEKQIAESKKVKIKNLELKQKSLKVPSFLISGEIKKIIIQLLNFTTDIYHIRI